ncbi:MAG: hypothetical protein LBR32_03780, partial [Propionibacteriaceae bacterium]|nr:hypothetical protein [Propionibacteriaceae bacterium]
MIVPVPPGALATPARPDEIVRYLSQAEAWSNERRQELDGLDQAILAAGRRDELTSDMKLALTLWQAIRNRLNEIEKVWDSGRVAAKELQQLATLLWGALDDMSVSVYEAGKLNDAITAGLRTKLNTDPGEEEQLARIRELRAQMERIRDQAALEPAAARPAAEAKYQALTERIEEAEAKRVRGGDVGGLLGPLVEESARLERDLIVGASKR